MKYTIKKDSFVAYKSCDNNDTEKYIVAIGHCDASEVIQFIEIEYTDEGEIIHFYDSSNEEMDQKYKTYKNVGTLENGIDKYIEFSGNKDLQILLQLYKDQGSDFEHKLNCSCPACDYCKFTIYRGDTIERVIEDFSRI